MKLTNENYHSKEANQAFMSVSQYKQFRKCEAMAMAEIRGDFVRDTTTAMLVGSYVDAYFTEDLEEFVGNHPEIISSRGSTKGQLKSEFRQAEEIIDRLMNDPFFLAFMQGKPQRIFTGEIANVPFKIKLDLLHANRLVDLKITRDFQDIWSEEEGRRVSWIRYWGYDIQAAVYREIVACNQGNYLPFYLAAATRERVMDKAVIEIAESVMKTRLEEVEALAPGYQAIKMGLVEPHRCEKCDYCKSTKVLTEIETYEGD